MSTSGVAPEAFFVLGFQLLNHVISYKLLTMPFSATTLALALTVAFSTSSGAATAAAKPVLPMLMPKVETVKEHVQSYFADIPIMAAVSSCESHFRQFDTDGTVYRGEINNKDVGVMQINEHYHLDEAQALGFDLYTLQGNLEFARYLYNREGTAPWSSSEYCWSKSAAASKSLASNTN